MVQEESEMKEIELQKSRLERIRKTQNKIEMIKGVYEHSRNKNTKKKGKIDDKDYLSEKLDNLKDKLHKKNNKESILDRNL